MCDGSDVRDVERGPLDVDKDSDVSRFLVIGFGNPGRLDDGLGPALAEALEPLATGQDKSQPGRVVTIDSNYQLSVEDAVDVRDHDVVLFVDAAVSGAEPFYVERVEPATKASFSTHTLDPAAVMGIASDLFGAKTLGFIIGIRGYEFNEFGQRLSPRAQKNLEAARQFLKEVLSSGSCEQLCAYAQRDGRVSDARR
jgi:hydrogenase maturation protease